MRRLIELHEEVDEVNYFLNEWQHIRQYKNTRAQLLQGPEVRFITRTIQRLIIEAETLEIPLVLAVDAHEGTAPARHITLTQCLKMTNGSGENVAFVGNTEGLLSLTKLAEMVSRGSRLVLAGSETGEWTA